MSYDDIPEVFRRAFEEAERRAGRGRGDEPPNDSTPNGAPGQGNRGGAIVACGLSPQCCSSFSASTASLRSTLNGSGLKISAMHLFGRHVSAHKSSRLFCFLPLPRLSCCSMPGLPCACAKIKQCVWVSANQLSRVQRFSHCRMSFFWRFYLQAPCPASGSCCCAM